jgi:hypothetical protein
MANFNSKSYLRKNSLFYPIIKSNSKKELHFFFNHKLHQIKNTVQVAKPLCKKMPYQSKNCVIHGYKFTNDYHDDDAFDFSHWDNDDNLIVYFIPMIEDENELNIFLITPYPPPLIERYDYCATPDKEYNLMMDKLRNRILKASPHARIRRQIRINEIDERN